MLQESEALLRVQQHAADARRSGEVLHLGRLLEGSLVAGARWGAWAVTLERCLAAARSIGDRSAEAWALHELGSRALCLGDAGTARALLNQAVKLREMLDDAAAVAASRRNLDFVLPPVIEYADSRATTPLAGVLDLDSLPLRESPPPAISNPTTHRASAVLLAAVAAVRNPRRSRVSDSIVASIRAFVQDSIERATARIETMRTVRRAAPEPAVLHQDEPGAVSSGSESVALGNGCCRLLIQNRRHRLRTGRASSSLRRVQARSQPAGPHDSATPSATLCRCALNRRLARSLRRER